jgi:aryl-alcohol dehydrogenase-like predicted oxidoreductase
MTKNHGRDRATFHKQLEESLTRLQVDHIDLLQYHEIIHEGEPQRIHTERALEAALEAREQGKIRYIGFTGHRWPRLLQEMLALPFEWDTAQMPINLLDAHYRSFAQDVLPTLIERNMGIIAMKSLAGGNASLLQTGVSPQEAIRYTLSQPVSTLITGIDSLDVLSQNVAIARAFVPMPSDEQKALLARVAPHAGDGHLEGYKIRP